MNEKSVQVDYSLERLKRLRRQLRGLSLDAVITLDSANLRWLSTWAEVFDDRQAHLALITPTRRYLHTDTRYNEAMQEKDTKGRWQISARPVNHFAYVRDLLAQYKKPELRLGYESTIRLDLYKELKKTLAGTKVKLVETKGLFEKLRAVKDEEEVRILRKAQSITDAAFADLLPLIKPGVSELELASRLEFALRERGAQGVSFPTIVASGPQSAFPHACPTKRHLRRGDLLVLDFGARYLDYTSDMTRTVVLGEATDKQRAIYQAVLTTLTKAKGFIKAGVTGKQAYDLAKLELKQAGLDEAFTHALGHGVGIEIHEQPTLSPLNTQELVAGNIVTVEPGVYLPGFGGVRIEDFGLVEETGFTSFTRSSRKLIEIT